MVLAAAMLGCTGTDDVGTVPDDPTTETADSGWLPPPILVATPGPIAVLSDPPDGGYHHHATLAVGPDDDFVVAWTSGHDPVTHAWAQRFSWDGLAIGSPQQLSDAHPAGQKPDIVAAPTGYLTAYDDRQGGIWLRGLDDDGALLGPARELHRTPPPTEADAVDLAAQADGSGIAIWTEFGAPGMDEDDGRIVWRAFTAQAAADGPPVIAEESSKKASDASALPDGGFAAVWAIHEPHPTIGDEVIYEVRGATFLGAAPVTFRADDLEVAWPSRPAVAVDALGRMSVSWRDKTSSGGEPLGAYGRLFDSDGTPLGPSIALAPGNGDRVVTLWAGSYAVYAWQQSDSAGAPGVWLAAVDTDGNTVLEPMEVSETGDLGDERPSIDLREVHGGWEILFVWETLIPASSNGDGLRARVVTLEPRPGTY